MGSHDFPGLTGDQINALITAYAAPIVHTHAAADIVSGVLANARVNWAAPSAIGGSTPAAGAFTTVNATGDYSQLGTSTGSNPLGMGLRNNNAGGSSRVNLLNSGGVSGSFAVYGSTFPVASFQNNTAFGAQNSIIIIADSTVSSGGTNSIQFRAGGYETTQERMRIYSDGSIIINDGGIATADIRIEGDTNANLFFLDASADFIGIKNNAPAAELDVTGTVRADGLRLDVTPTAETPSATHTFTISLNGTNYKVLCVAA